MFFLALMPLKNSLFLLFHIKHNLYLFLISDTNIMYFSGTSKFLRNFFQNIFQLSHSQVRNRSNRDYCFEVLQYLQYLYEFDFKNQYTVSRNMTRNSHFPITKICRDGEFID